MSGLGSHPFGNGPFGQPPPVPSAEVLPTLSSSRLVDGVSSRYVPTTDGDFEPMDGTAQRVLLLIAFADTYSPIITPQGKADQAARIRRALRPLTEGREPAIDRLTVEVTDDGKAETLKTVTYRNRLTNTIQTVTP